MNIQTAEIRLKKRGIQPTAMRLLVYRFMAGYGSAVSLADLEEHFTRSDRTTLYRTLKTFSEKGLAHRFQDLEGTTRYAVCAEECDCSYPDDMHAHFYCSSCETAFCLPKLGVPDHTLPENFTASHVNFVISGTCPSCPV
jgi:Fur family transcriptional regulator, ferric uptake regulator